eukprot:15749764-Heterocapsa_arctica.AAC.1
MQRTAPSTIFEPETTIGPISMFTVQFHSRGGRELEEEDYAEITSLCGQKVAGAWVSSMTQSQYQQCICIPIPSASIPVII